MLIRMFNRFSRNIKVGIKFGINFLYRFYANEIMHMQWISRYFAPFDKPTILLVSYPRSGSTWISSILGFSPDIAYLFEPVSTPFLEKTKKHHYLPTIQDSDFNLFVEISDQAFNGIPPKTNNGIAPREVHLPIIRSIKDFWFPNRKNLRLLIKEINPQATDFFINRYAPNTIILLRHPAAVAESHERLGFLKNILDFESFGYHYGTVLSEAIQASSRTNTIIIYYERFTLNPEFEFSKLFSQLNIREPANFYRILEKFCNTQSKITDPHQIRRVSAIHADKWRSQLDTEKVEAVMKGYFRSSLQYYRDETWIS
jgi:hypothetical protein